MRPVHIEEQISIARNAAYSLLYYGYVHKTILFSAIQTGISEGRLRAMIKYIQTKGEPK